MQLLPWDWAFSRARDVCLDPIEEAWRSLLDAGAPETTLTEFVARHAGFFLGPQPETHFVLRELRLGADYSIDFVVPTDNASVGVSYELIECERPDTPAFNSKGDPSQRLTHAISQILDWKMWLNGNTAEMRNLFPAPAQVGPGYEIAFTYTIVIGRRSEGDRHVAKRNALAEMHGITIRSFDWLTDRLRTAKGAPPGPLTPCTEANGVAYEHAYVLKNPFYVALGDAEWRTLRGALRHHPHLVATNAPVFAASRRFNREALGALEAYCASFPVEAEAAAREDQRLYQELTTRRY